MCDADWEWFDTLEVSIEVVNEGCNEMDVVSPDLPSGELLEPETIVNLISKTFIYNTTEKPFSL